MTPTPKTPDGQETDEVYRVRGQRVWRDGAELSTRRIEALAARLAAVARARREAELRAAYPVGTRVWLRGDPTPRTVTGYTDSPGLPPSLRLSGHTIARPRQVTRNPPDLTRAHHDLLSARRPPGRPDPHGAAPCPCPFRRRRRPAPGCARRAPGCPTTRPRPCCPPGCTPAGSRTRRTAWSAPTLPRRRSRSGRGGPAAGTPGTGVSESALQSSGS